MNTNIVIRGVGLVAISGALFAVMSGAKDRQAVAASPTDDINPPMTATQQAPDLADNGLEFDPLSDKDLATTYGVDVDSPEETMRTLTRELQAVREQSKRVEEENERLRAETQRLLNMETTISGRVEDKVDGAQRDLEEQAAALREQRRESETLMQKLEARLKQLEASTEIAEKGPRRPGSATSAAGYDIGTANIPDGLGFGSGGGASDQIIWKNPLDATVDAKKGTVTLPEFSPSTSMLPEGEEIRGEKGKKEPQSMKAYTLPANSTLMGSTAMTALVGRIPIDGQLTDPYPAKIIVGPENLASNGISIPNVQGIVMSGIAKGDWTLSCSSMKILSMTFTFNDGSISTYPDPEGGGAGNDPIGWISDEFGIPCVSGKRITNAVSYLGTRIGLGAASAYAGAIAEGEYTNTVSPEGTTRSLTGSATTAARNQAWAGGLDEVGDWLDKRQEQSFDSIYTPPGTKVHIHLDKQIAIDYPINGGGRKVQHDEFMNFSAARVGGLD